MTQSIWTHLALTQLPVALQCPLEGSQEMKHLIFCSFFVTVLPNNVFTPPGLLTTSSHSQKMPLWEHINSQLFFFDAKFMEDLLPRAAEDVC